MLEKGAWRRWLERGFWLLFLFGIVGLLFMVNRSVGKVKVAELPVSPLSLSEVQLLKEYHGARAVKFENGRWYFLGPRGRHWYPLTTSMACRDLRLSCTETASK